MTERQRRIHNAAREILVPNWVASTDESLATKKSLTIALLWQAEFLVLKNLDGVLAEYPVAGTKERFDLVDTVERTVYELKSSAKNPHHEFYKDIFKVWVHNRNAPADAFCRFVFLVPNPGATQLRRGLGAAVMARSTELGFEVEVHDVARAM